MFPAIFICPRCFFLDVLGDDAEILPAFVQLLPQLQHLLFEDAIQLIFFLYLLYEVLLHLLEFKYQLLLGLLDVQNVFAETLDGGGVGGLGKLLGGEGGDGIELQELGVVGGGGCLVGFSFEGGALLGGDRN